MPSLNIPAPVLAELQRQMNHELAAAHAYQALSIWCEVRTFKGFAAFFSKQAGEEREHARKLIDHLLDRDGTPEIAALPKPRQEFASLLEVARHALEMEQANTRGINAVYEAAVAARDYPAQVLMHWFISEQVEEEAWCSELIDRVEGATSAGALVHLDQHVVELLSEDD